MVNTKHIILALCIPALAACRGNSSSHSGGGGSSILDLVAYETRTEQPVGLDQMVDACFADLDGDGIPDAVVVDVDGNLQILIGQGGGTFSPALPTPLKIGGVGIAVRCDNVDSLLPEGSPLPDIVVVSANPDQATVLINDGQGGFEVTAQFPTGVVPDAVILGECTGDNQPDLVVTHLSASDVLLFPGLGDGTFGTGQPLFMPNGSRTSGLTYGDANHDAIPDVLICDIDNDRIIMFPGLADAFGNPAGTHGGPVPIPVGLSPIDIALGDLDSDGLDDIAVTNFDGQTIDIKVHTGANQFVTVESLQVDGRPALLHVADVTGDGYNDVVTSVLSRSTVALFPGKASGGFGEQRQFGASGSPYRPLSEDLNQDGRPDMIVASTGTDRLNIYFGDDDGLTGALYERTPLANPEFVANADFFGDGSIHVAVSSFDSDSVAIMVADPKAESTDVGLRSLMTINMGRNVRNIVPTDINKDGKTDLLVAIDGGVKILANESSATALSFRTVPEDPNLVLAPGVGAFEMLGRDLNDDDLVDIVVAYINEDRVSVLLSAGTDFVFTAPRSVSVGSGPLGLAAGDFNGDAQLEVAVTSRDVSQVSIIHLDASGDPEVEMLLPVGGGPNFIRTGDFNGDGRDDLVLSNGEVDTVEVLISSKTGGFLSLALEAGRRPTALLAEDLNMDGDLDILFTSNGSADFRVALGDGDGGFEQALIFPGAIGASSAILRDLNGNGLQDLIVASTTNRRLAVFKNISSSSN